MVDDGRLAPEGYLAEVGARLPFGDAECAEILRELADHLADSAASLEASGLAPDAAARAARERLGSPDALARELTRARRTPGRLLAAAGAGTWAALGAGIYGLLWGVLLSLVVAVVASVATQAVAGALRLDWHGFDPGWNSMVSVVPLWVALYVAGRAVTPTVAARAGYDVRVVRRATVVVGGTLAAAYALGGWSGALNWPAVIAVLLLPAWWIAGAWHGRRTAALGGRRWLLTAGLLAGLLVVGVALVGLAGAQVHTEPSAVGGPVTNLPDPDTAFARIGAPVPAAVAAAEVDDGLMTTRSGALTGGAWLATVVTDRAVLDGWTDLRIEAWQAVPPWTYFGVDPAATGPFAEGSVQWSPPGSTPDGSMQWSSSNPYPPTAATLSGALRLDRAPGVNWGLIAITGLGPDGHRHLIVGPDFEQVAFQGTVWDWLAALGAGG